MTIYKLKEIVSNTVVCESLAVFSMPQIRKTGQCLEVHMVKIFREFLAEISNFLKFRETFLYYSRPNYDEMKDTIWLSWIPKLYVCMQKTTQIYVFTVALVTLKSFFRLNSLVKFREKSENRPMFRTRLIWTYQWGTHKLGYGGSFGRPLEWTLAWPVVLS